MASVVFNMDQFVAADHLDRGIALFKQNRFVEALVEYENVLRINPSDRYALWNKSVALLSIGDYVNGMPDHTWTWVYDWHALSLGEKNLDKFFTLPVWRGEQCRLLAYNETGFGDAIMLLRFLPELVEKNKNVTMVVRPELASLMQGYGADVIDYVPGDMAGFDARVTFYSLLSVLGHTLQTIPSAPYIHADFKFSGGKVGIAWSGNSRKELDLVAFLSGLDIDDSYEIFALQKSVLEKRASPKAGLVYPLRCRDFKETAELIETLDHIITVDTAAAHLAGAMGHPSIHLLLPYVRDWRWWHSDVWYPTIKVYPQDTPDDWDKPFARVNAALRK